MPQPQAIPQSVYGYAVRTPFPRENTFFMLNPDTTGMAANDGRIVLNPYSGLTYDGQVAVAKNEAIRLFMRENKIDPQFKVTPKQMTKFQDTAYGTNEPALRQTLVARILTNDKSAGDVTDEQRRAAESIMQQLSKRNAAK
jgi:hypothetical protein